MTTRSFGPDLKRFSVFTLPARDFFRDYHKINLTYHDFHGTFGAEKFHYFLHWRASDKKKFGVSKVYLRLQTKKSLENMRDDLYYKISTRMEEYSIDLEEVKRENLIVVACDSVDASMISDSAFSVFFTPAERKEGEQDEEEA